MRSLFRIFGLSVALISVTSVGALADVPPQCPGGGVAKGTFHCTGPVLHPVCTEGPPWTCSLPAGSGLVMEMGDTPKPGKLRPGRLAGPVLAFSQ